MARPTKKSKSMSGSVKALLFLGAAGAACYLGIRTMADTTLRPLPVQSKPAAPAPARPEADVKSVKIFVVKVAGNEATLEPMTCWVPREAEPKVAAIKRLLSVGKQGGDSVHLIPAGTRLLSLNTDRGLATIDLSREFLDNFSGGSLQESLTLGAIVRTLTQFRDVDRVQILVEGRAVDTLGGHFGIAEPLAYKSGELARAKE